MKRSQMTVPLIAATVLGLVTLVSIPLATRYPGLINIGAEFAGGKGHIVIDGRSIDRSTVSAPS